MRWKELLTGLIIGAILGVSGAFYTLSQRIVKIETQLEQFQSTKKQLEATHTNNDENASPNNQPILPTYRLTLTTGVNDDGTPKDSLDTLAINMGAVCFHLHWFNLLPDKEYKVQYKLFDENGKLVYQPNELKFTSDISSYYTSFCYKFRKDIDKPGQWMLNVYMDDREVVKKSIRVSSD
jgi:hypothetical protein